MDRDVNSVTQRKITNESQVEGTLFDAQDMDSTACLCFLFNLTHYVIAV